MQIDFYLLRVSSEMKVPSKFHVSTFLKVVFFIHIFIQEMKERSHRFYNASQCFDFSQHLKAALMTPLSRSYPPLSLIAFCRPGLRLICVSCVEA